MFVMLSTWRATSPGLPVSERVALTLSEAAVSVTITSLTDVLGFGVGIFIPFRAVQVSDGCFRPVKSSRLVVDVSIGTLQVSRVCTNVASVQVSHVFVQVSRICTGVTFLYWCHVFV